MTRHSWGEADRHADEDGRPTRTVRACVRCDLRKITVHVPEPPWHWIEFWRGTEQVPGRLTPACEPVEVPA